MNNDLRDRILDVLNRWEFYTKNAETDELLDDIHQALDGDA